MSHRGRRIRAVLIAGPTASGKSALALRLAERLGGTIVNADSMQVYRDLRVLTARPGEAEEARVPHRLYGTIDGATAYSVSRWLVDVAAVLADASAEGHLPIVVGGTGLYFKALTQGLSAIPPVPDDIRAEVRSWATHHAAEDLHAILASRDEATAARLRSSDTQRIVRALEVNLATGRSLAAYQETRADPVIALQRCVALVLAPERELLRARVDRRFDAMMDAGALEETARLAARDLPPALPIMRSLGVPPLLRHLRGELDLAQATERAKIDTRQYLKRQETFARHQLPGFRRVEPDSAEAMVLDQFA